MKNTLDKLFRIILFFVVVLSHAYLFRFDGTNTVYIISIVSIICLFFVHSLNPNLLLKVSILYFLFSIVFILMEKFFLTERMLVSVFLLLFSWVFLILINKKFNYISVYVFLQHTYADINNIVIILKNNPNKVKFAIYSSAILYFIKQLFDRLIFYIQYFIEDKLHNYFIFTGKIDLILVSGFIISFFLLKKYYNLSSLIWKSLYILIFLSLFSRVLPLTTAELRTYPNILKISPDSGTIWSQVRLKGQNFGSAKYDKNEVYLEGIPHRVIKWTNQEIIFIIDPIKSKSGFVWVSNQENKVSNKVKFEYIE